MLSLRTGSDTLRIMCPVMRPLDVLKAKIHIRMGFAKSLLWASPALARAYVVPSTRNKQRAKQALGMRSVTHSHILEAQFFERVPAEKATPTLTLVMPVFNAFEVLCDALEHVVQNTELPWRLILVEDCSTDERVRPMLRAWSARHIANDHEIRLIENDENLGFIGSVNRAFDDALSFEDHVVLLNSDALVPRNWAHRIIAPILYDVQVASVTPMSNDAEIFSSPVVCDRFEMRPNEGAEIDEILAQNVNSRSFKAAPTGVGFCMALNRNFLRKFPHLDKAFGKGYGEEVDWCNQTTAIGGVHVVQPSLYVEHRGGSSFGSLEKQRAIARNSQIISKRYPNYDRSVQAFIAADPIRTARLFTAFAQISVRQESTDIFIAHSLGGGAELFLKDAIARRQAQGQATIVLRVGGTLRWRLEAHLQSGTIFGDTDDDDLMMTLLSQVKNTNIIYSCAVGDKDSITLPSVIAKLIDQCEAKFTFLIHDFFAISPSYCLLDTDGVFRASSIMKTVDLAHTITDCTGRRVSLLEWQKNWRALLQHAHRIECFSQSSADILASFYPKLRPNIRVVPHEVAPVRPIVLNGEANLSALGVLGDIGFQKGAKCVQAVSMKLPGDTFDNLVVVGKLDPRYSMSEHGIETGVYLRKDIPDLAEKHNIKAWFIPSIWPETFSFTTHETLATGLPVFCFDIGAQSEAAAIAENGHCMPLDWADKPQLILSYIAKVLRNDAKYRRFNNGIEKPRSGGSPSQYWSRDKAAG